MRPSWWTLPSPSDIRVHSPPTRTSVRVGDKTWGPRTHYRRRPLSEMGRTVHTPEPAHCGTGTYLVTGPESTGCDET